MSDITENEFETVDDNTQPGRLRQLLEQALANNRQLAEKLSKAEAAEVQRSVKSTWDGLKAPAKVRAMYKGEESPEAIQAWWDDYKDLFNLEAAENAPVEPEPTEQELAQQQAAQQFQEASALGTNAIHSGFDAVKQKADNAAEAYRNGQMSRADFDAARAQVYEGLNTPKY